MVEVTVAGSIQTLEQIQTQDGLTGITLVLLYGSWNGSLLSRTSTLDEHHEGEDDDEDEDGASLDLDSTCYEKLVKILVPSACGSENGNVGFQVASLFADRDEESLAYCINTMKCPPELPSLFLVLSQQRNNNTTEGEIVLEPVSIDSITLLTYLQTQSKEQRINPSLAMMENAVQTAWIELKQRLWIGDNNNNISTPPPSILPPNQHQQLPPLRIFIAGGGTHAGKSSICLGILGTLLFHLHYPPSSLAYIKPATQCEEPQLVHNFCDAHGIERYNDESGAAGPLVYYKGFTRAFLAGQTEHTEALLQRAARAVDEMANVEGRRVVLVDGVGYPAVGSICGTDNAQVAISCGYPCTHVDRMEEERVPAAVLLVGKSGVGDAVDSYNLNATYFRAAGVPVIGAVFNRLKKDGYYSLENCREAVSLYFDTFLGGSGKFEGCAGGDGNKRKISGECVYGFVPEVEGIAGSRTTSGTAGLKDAWKHVQEFISIFARNVDVKGILERAQELRSNVGGGAYDDLGNSKKKTRVAATNAGNSHSIINTKMALEMEESSSSVVPLSRRQIEEAARNQGAAGG